MKNGTWKVIAHTIALFNGWNNPFDNSTLFLTLFIVHLSTATPMAIAHANIVGLKSISLKCHHNIEMPLNRRNKSFKWFSTSDSSICNHWISSYLTLKRNAMQKGIRQGIAKGKRDVNSSTNCGLCSI